MNTKKAFKGEKEDEKLLFKQWARINGNGSNENNDPDFSPLAYKTSQVGRKIPFSIGDIWTERLGKKVYSYKVISLEDIIIPAGAYRCCKIVEEMDNYMKNYYWFAPDVGLVKWEMAGIKGVLQGLEER
ncbi:MAG: hypothetical protein HZA05_02790 [Nitrospirae bacterium]|nr:hypothetical protein [Nitrospirota bacterium]